MPIVRAPLFSATASGTLAKTLTYEDRPTYQRVRQRVTPRDPNTPMQRLTRDAIRTLAAAWQALPEPTKTAWKYAATTRNTNGYSLFWSEYFAQNIQPPNLPQVP